MQIFHVRGGRVRGERGWVADRVDESGSERADRAVPAPAVRRRRPGDTDRDAVPREILVPVDAAVGRVAEHRLLSERRGRAVCASGCRSAGTSGR